MVAQGNPQASKLSQNGRPRGQLASYYTNKGTAITPTRGQLTRSGEKWAPIFTSPPCLKRWLANKGTADTPTRGQPTRDSQYANKGTTNQPYGTFCKAKIQQMHVPIRKARRNARSGPPPPALQGNGVLDAGSSPAQNLPSSISPVLGPSLALPVLGLSFLPLL